MNDVPKKNKWQEYKEKNGLPSSYLVDPKTKKVDSALAQERMAFCRACPEFITTVDQCKKCGCFMDSKTKLEASSCPLGKW